VSQYRPFNDAVISTLQRLHQEGYSLLILSNQKGIGKAVDGKKASTVYHKTHTQYISMSSIIFYDLPLSLLRGKKVKGAIDAFIKMSGVPMDACLSLGADSYRKPDIGMWKVFICGVCLFVCVQLSIYIAYLSVTLLPLCCGMTPLIF
jgi:histidinol phosphatase-like enzyme